MRPCTPDGTLILDDDEERPMTRQELLEHVAILEAEAARLRAEAEKLPIVREMPDGDWLVRFDGKLSFTPTDRKDQEYIEAGFFYPTRESAEHAGPELVYIRRVQRWLADCGGEGPKSWTISINEAGAWVPARTCIMEPAAKGNRDACAELCRRLNAGEVVL